MLVDVVIDTNVLMHCSDPREPRQQASLELTKCLLSGAAHLCVDEGFDLNSGKNASHIGHEYIKHLRFGMPGYHFVTEIAKRSRLKPLPMRAGDAGVRRKVNQLIRNRTDRCFLGVAHNSASRVLVSHDFTDFPVPKRTTIRADLDVSVLECTECRGLAGP
jgi:hypothetical protein